MTFTFNPVPILDKFRGVHAYTCEAGTKMSHNALEFINQGMWSIISMGDVGTNTTLKVFSKANKNRIVKCDQNEAKKYFASFLTFRIKKNIKNS